MQVHPPRPECQCCGVCCFGECKLLHRKRTLLLKAERSHTNIEIRGCGDSKGHEPCRCRMGISNENTGSPVQRVARTHIEPPEVRLASPRLRRAGKLEFLDGESAVSPISCGGGLPTRAGFKEPLFCLLGPRTGPLGPAEGSTGNNQPHPAHSCPSAYSSA